MGIPRHVLHSHIATFQTHTQPLSGIGTKPEEFTWATEVVIYNWASSTDMIANPKPANDLI